MISNFNAQVELPNRVHLRYCTGKTCQILVGIDSTIDVASNENVELALYQMVFQLVIWWWYVWNCLDIIWLVLWNIFMKFHSVGNLITPTEPNWRTPSFFRGVGWNHQQVMEYLEYTVWYTWFIGIHRYWLDRHADRWSCWSSPLVPTYRSRYAWRKYKIL